jgi:hypothetical protein
MDPGGLVTARLVLAWLLLLPAIGAAQTTQEIFHIERSKNGNVVRYDARLTKEGQLDPKNPVFAYFRRPDGSTFAITAIEFKFFYGFKVKLDESGKFWHFSIAAAKDRSMKLYLVDGKPRAEGRIAGVQAYVTKFFVKFKQDTIIPGVDWVDLYGNEITTGRAVHERVVPK